MLNQNFWMIAIKAIFIRSIISGRGTVWINSVFKSKTIVSGVNLFQKRLISKWLKSEPGWR
jgi:hypothetical protein